MRTILVLGATGAQGGSVARHLLADGRWTVRALTRHPEGERARALAAAGAEIVRGDLDDPASIRRALVDCDGVFGVTSFWEHFDREVEHGRTLLAAIAEAGVRDVVLHTLADYAGLSGGTHRVPHYDGKARLEREARAMGLGAVFLHVAYYYENCLGFFPPRLQPDGTWLFGYPQGDTPLAAVSVEDVGGVVTALFEDLGPWRDRVVGVVGDDLPPAAYAAMMARELDRPIVYRHVPREVYAALGFPGAEELAAMFDFQRLHIPNRRADLALSRTLHPAIRSFDQWIRENRERVRQALDATVPAAA